MTVNRFKASSAIHFEQLYQAEVAIAFNQVTFDFLHAGHLHYIVRDVARRLIISGADKLTYYRDKQWTQTELVESHAQQQQCRHRVAGHLSAKPNFLTCTARDIDDFA